MIVGIIFIVTWFIIVQVSILLFHKLKWGRVMKELIETESDYLGIYEIIVRQPGAVAITPKVLSSKIFFGINRAKIYRNSDIIILLPWSVDVFIKKYFRPFQLILVDSAPILKSIPRTWTFIPTSFVEQENEFKISFDATATRTTKVELRCIRRITAANNR
jgi:hypothetical protein